MPVIVVVVQTIVLHLPAAVPILSDGLNDVNDDDDDDYDDDDNDDDDSDDDEYTRECEHELCDVEEAADTVARRVDQHNQNKDAVDYFH